MLSEKRYAARMPMEQLSLLVGMNVLGLTLSLLLVLPARTFNFAILGSQASLVFSGSWLFAMLLSVMTAAGVESIMRAHPRVHLSATQYTVILWILPCILVAGTTFILPLVRDSAPFAFLTIVGAGVLLVLVVMGEYLTIDLQDSAYAFARLGLNLVVYLAALALFQTIYAFKLRSILSAPFIGIFAALLALELLRASEADVRRTWLYAATVGLALGEALWALNYWNVNPLLGGVTLLVLFYLLTGFAQQYLMSKLSWRTALEFAIVAAFVAFVVLRRVT
ncbi:MAG: hypothetical protein HY741_23670 [Chloroflexi bacterium]|nr:hypothetical protein [Chloroflexota bacterium]